ncbi:MAG: PEP-CTERM sorting domain-containing protein [Planctomycetaceae bacterium]|nr:PEP-CTERM sorting domain-containing protein [Planctomycetaceae bacterium]
MLRLKEKGCANWRNVLPLIGGGLSMLACTIASAKVVPYSSGVLAVGDRNVAASGGGVFSENVAVKSLTVGSRTIKLESGDFREPIAVRLYGENRAKPDTFDVVPDNEIDKPEGVFEFALTKEMVPTPGMTALDAISSPDFGRMIRPTGRTTSRIQVFLPLPETDNDPVADDDNPEMLVMAPVPNGSVKLTPILAGTADKPETLVFGTTKLLPPSVFESGATNVSMILGNDPTPHRICVIGLDLSGDLGVPPGQSVVGYQIEVPASGASLSTNAVASIDLPTRPRSVGLDLRSTGTFMNFVAAAGGLPLKISGIGLQQQMLAQAADDFTQVVGDALLGAVDGPSTPQQSNIPPLSPVTPWSDTPFDDDPGFNNPPIIPPPPPVPAPGAAALLGLAAAAFGKRRRRA